MSILGTPTARLQEIAARYRDAMVRSEMVALDALETDDDIDPKEFMDFLKFRAAAGLVAAFGNDVDDFNAAALKLPAMRTELHL